MRNPKSIITFTQLINQSINMNNENNLQPEQRTYVALTQSPSVDSIIAYESGELSDQEIVYLFAELVQSGMAWSLQGSYGRTANDLIKAGWIDRKGNVSLAVLEL